jgi:cell division protein ZapA (FtsZ GTPase activity inhibitor)
MSKLSLKVVVAGRTYPLTVNPGEEAKVTKAAEEINRAIKVLQDNYAVKDMQDLLAMTALQLSTRSAQASTSAVQPDFSEVESSLERLSRDIDDLD